MYVTSTVDLSSSKPTASLTSQEHWRPCLWRIGSRTKSPILERMDIKQDGTTRVKESTCPRRLNMKLKHMTLIDYLQRRADNRRPVYNVGL